MLLAKNIIDEKKNGGKNYIRLKELDQTFVHKLIKKNPMFNHTYLFHFKHKITTFIFLGSGSTSVDVTNRAS